ncbi:MAG: diguanylate cyclase, partial [Oscillospiraceae bacterium]
MKFFRRSSPIFRKILIPMSLLVIFEIALLIGGLFLGGVTTYLDQNERDILHERGINRKTYLENEMVNSWANVGTAVSAINQKAQALLESGAISLDTL